MPLRYNDPLASAYNDTFVNFGGESEDEAPQYNPQDPYVFLYPEASGGQQYEVWQNRLTGEYQQRNFSSFAGSPTPPAPTTPSWQPMGGTMYPSPGATGFGESEDPQGTPYTPMPIPYTPPATEPFQLPGRTDEALAGIGDTLGTTLGAWAEPFAVARAGGPSFYGQDLGPIAQFINEIQQYPPVLSTAAAASELAFGTAIRELGAVGVGLLRSTKLFDDIATQGLMLARSEQGAVPLGRGAVSVNVGGGEAIATAKLADNPSLEQITSAMQQASGSPRIRYSVTDDEGRAIFTGMATSPDQAAQSMSRFYSSPFAKLPDSHARLAVNLSEDSRLVTDPMQMRDLSQGKFMLSDGSMVADTSNRLHGEILSEIGIRPEDFLSQGGARISISTGNSPMQASELFLQMEQGAKLTSQQIQAINAMAPRKTIVSVTRPGGGLEGAEVFGIEADTPLALRRLAQFNARNPEPDYTAGGYVPGLSSLLKDEGGWIAFGKSSGVSPTTAQALSGSKSLHPSDIMRTIQEATTNRIAGIERAAKHISDTELKQVIDDFNQVGSVVTKAAERSRMVYERVGDIAAKAGVTKADMPTFQDDVSKFLYAQTAAAWRKLHPRAHDRPFGSFTTTKEAANWLTQYKTGGTIGEVEAAAKVVADDHRRMRDTLYQAGGLTQAAYKELSTNYPWYNPLKYTNIANDAALGNADAMQTLGALRGKIHELADDVPAHGEVVNPLDSVFLANNSLERFVANNTFVRKTIDVLRRDPQLQGQVRKLNPNSTHNPDIERAMVVFENGGVQRWAVPKWAAGEVEHVVAHDADNEIIGFVNTLNKWWRIGAIEQNPAFIATNFVLDHLNAYARAGTIPGTAIPQMIRYLRGVDTNHVQRVLRLAGGEQSKFFANATRQEKLKLAKSLQSEANRDLNLEDPESVRRRILSFLPNVGRATEQGQRTKAFESSMDNYVPGWRQMDPVDAASQPMSKRAVTDALESIINYHRGGWLTRNLDRLIPFTNVAVQGTLLPLRIAQTPQGRMRLASLAGLWTGLSWYNNSYPENADVPSYIRYGTLYAMLPTDKYTVDGKPIPNYIVLSPALRDLVPLKGLSEVLIENFIAQSPTAGHGIAAQILANAPTGVGPGPAIDLAAILAFNYDTFRGQSVVPESEQALPAELQFGIGTSRTFKELGDLLGMSPRTMQAVFESATTGPGKMALGSMDWILETFFPDAPDQVSTIADKLQTVPPEHRETILTMLPSALREQVERQSFKRDPNLPLVGSIQKRFDPGTGGELERVFPRDEKARTSDMNEAMGTDAIRVLRELGKAPPLMNETFSKEGHYTKFSDEQLSNAHNMFRDYLSVSLAPLLTDDRFAALKRESYTDAAKLVDDILTKTENTIKALYLTPAQRENLGMPKTLTDTEKKQLATILSALGGSP